MLALTSARYGDSRWQGPGDGVEQALLLRVVGMAARRRITERGKIEPLRKALNEKLANLKLGELFPAGVAEAAALASDAEGPISGIPSSRIPSSALGPVSGYDAAQSVSAATDSKDDVPVLRAARVMHALIATPRGNYSRAVVFCYYRILRELYATDAPDWTVGGARAGEGGTASAFVTGECARAVLALARALTRTADLMGHVHYLSRQLPLPRSDGEPARWCADVPRAWIEAEQERAALAFCVDGSCLSTRVLMGHLDDPAKAGPASLVRYLEGLPRQLVSEIDEYLPRYEEAVDEIVRFRAQEESQPKGRLRYQRLESAHQFALHAVSDTGERLRELRKLLADQKGAKAGDEEEIKPWTEVPWDKVKKQLESATKHVTNTLRPVQHFLESVLDAELNAAASEGKRRCDCAELVFAATSYGAITGMWDDDRLTRAAEVLARAIDSRGQFPSGRAFHVKDKGYKLHAVGSEITRAYAQLLSHTDATIDAELARRILRPFLETLRVQGVEPGAAWTHEQPPRPARPVYWTTAIAVGALDGIIRMLDQRINARIERHFSVTRPGTLKLQLHELVYGDYGVCREEILGFRRESVAISLQRMRAHLTGSELFDEMDPLWSLILHGPPGTGKTTVLEALALSSRKTLYAVTPSDIIVGGAEAVERRARAVFEALSMVTDSVVLFDEFDPILRARDPNDKVPGHVFAFLTPGMLPKLKKLHDAAEHHRVVYALATNLIGTLDAAAIRPGRFDEKVGIYTPDLLSRAGRLLAELGRFVADIKEKEPHGNWKNRVAHVVARTGERAVGKLGRPGWLRAPGRDRLSGDHAFGYIFGRDNVSWPKDEADPPLGGVGAPGSHEEREHYEWNWIHDWEDSLPKEGVLTWEKLLEVLSKPPESRPAS